MNGSFYLGWFELGFETPKEILLTGQENNFLGNIKFSYLSLKYMLCVCFRIISLSNSNEYIQQTIILQKIEKASQAYVS